jgi:hypothetical protein
MFKKEEILCLIKEENEQKQRKERFEIAIEMIN